MNKVNKFLMIGILLLAVVIPLTTWLAVSNQENRSSAASETEEVSSIDENVVDGVCGEMNGGSVTEIPDNRYACAKGAVNWMDTVAEDGSYNWDCIGKMDGVIANCEVSLEK